jgi:hypothetical protein
MQHRQTRDPAVTGDQAGLEPSFWRRQPWGALLMCLGLWALLALLHLAVTQLRDTDPPVLFPMSVFEGPTLHVDGVPYLAAFLALLALARRRGARFAPAATWALAWP